VAMNPVIKFTTLFGLLAVELALSVFRSRGDAALNYLLAAVFFLVAAYFVWRSFYGMRIGTEVRAAHAGAPPVGEIAGATMGTDMEGARSAADRVPR
jgi:K(+)-stimulated pyrophosphate-energized sodium pump